MRVVITGGTGLIGRALSAALAADGYEVVVLSRSPERNLDLPAGVRAERWDGRTGNGWVHLADGAEAIVNLAGANIAGEGFWPGRWTAERKHLIQDSRVNAGSAVVDAVSQASKKPGAVIQSSGVGYYGPHGDEVLTEEASPGNDFLARLAHEQWEPSTAAVEDMGVRRVIIRSGVVLDAKQDALPRMLLPFRLFAGGRIGSGRQWHSWIHLADEAAAIRFLIENKEASGPFNLAAPNPLTNAELARVLGRVLGRPVWFPVPAFAMKLAFGELSNVLLEGQRVVPERLLAFGFGFRFPDAETALPDLLKRRA
jgi:hypothetical protein